MASRSTQPFCHNTLSGHTDTQTDKQKDRPTDEIGDMSTPTAFTLAVLIDCDVLTTHSSQERRTNFILRVTK